MRWRPDGTREWSKQDLLFCLWEYAFYWFWGNKKPQYLTILLIFFLFISSPLAMSLMERQPRCAGASSVEETFGTVCFPLGASVYLSGSLAEFCGPFQLWLPVAGAESFLLGPLALCTPFPIQQLEGCICMLLKHAMEPVACLSKPLKLKKAKVPSVAQKPLCGHAPITTIVLWVCL